MIGVGRMGKADGGGGSEKGPLGSGCGSGLREGVREGFMLGEV